MKSIKSLFVLSFLIGMMSLGFQSCSQYPDNEGITFVSKTDRVSKTWKIDNYKVNDVDYTSLFSGYTETFTKLGAYSYQWGIIGGNGTWVFQNKDAEILITGTNNQATKTLFILKLAETEFWYYYMDGTDKKEYHFVQ